MHVIFYINEGKGVEINDIIANYVKGRGRILERNRQTICEDLGGYGIIDVRVLNKSVKSTWIRDGVKREIFMTIRCFMR